MVWLNFWDAKDPIAGALDFYLVDYRLDENGNKVGLILDDGTRSVPDFAGNIQLKMNKKTPWEAHSGYWDYVSMYDEIFRRVV